MSEALTFRSPKVSRGEQILNRFLWSIIILLIVFLIAELLFHFVISPGLIVKKIIVKSDLHLSEPEVLSIAGITEKEYYFSLNPEEIQSNLNAYPLVKRSVVEKVFPGTLKLTIYGRDPLVIAFAEGDKGRSVPVAIDEDGVVFQIGSGITNWDLPVISGLKFKDLNAGMELPEILNAFFADMKTLKGSYPELFRLISEVRIIPRGGTGYELLLCPLVYSIKVRFGSSISARNLKSAIMILDLLEKQGLADRVKELDFRTGEIVYRIKEE